VDAKKPPDLIEVKAGRGRLTDYFPVFGEKALCNWYVLPEICRH